VAEKKIAPKAAEKKTSEKKTTQAATRVTKKAMRRSTRAKLGRA